MKIGVLSDTHKNKASIERALEILSDVDLYIHAGDNFSDSVFISKKTKKPIIAVKGNCDFESGVEDEILFEIEGFLIFLTHGHKYLIKNSYDFILEKAKQLGANIVIFGHSHESELIKKDQIYLLNPGSTALPRGFSKASVALIDINGSDVNIKHLEL